MNVLKSEPASAEGRKSEDKQLRNINLNDVLEKRRLDQALNVKEFAVLAGVSYSTARSWFHLAGFPVFRGVVFWQDFVQWRTIQHRSNENRAEILPLKVVSSGASLRLPPRAAKILREATTT